MTEKSDGWVNFNKNYPPIGIDLICKDNNGERDEYHFHSSKHRSDCIISYGLIEWKLII